MLVDTLVSECLRAGFEAAVPFKRACRVVAAVDIVMIQDLALVAIISWS